MMTDENALAVQRSLGKIEGRLDGQDERHERMERAQKEQGEILAKIVRLIERERGARKVWRTVGAGIAAVVSGAVSLGVTWWTSKHG